MSETQVISKFLKLKKEENAQQQGNYSLRHPVRNRGRAGPVNRNKPEAALVAVQNDQKTDI